MKKIFRTIKLLKYKTMIEDLDMLKEREGQYFAILFADGTYSFGDLREVKEALERDHIKRVAYIFDEVDKIIIDRGVRIDA